VQPVLYPLDDLGQVLIVLYIVQVVRHDSEHRANRKGCYPLIVQYVQGCQIVAGDGALVFAPAAFDAAEKGRPQKL